MSRASAPVKRAIARWQRGTAGERTRFTEAGDTLIEVLLTIIVLGLAVTALLAGFATAITSSANSRDLTNLDASSRAATNAAIAQVQADQASAFGSCPNSWTPTWQPLGNSYTITKYSIQYWSSTTTPGFQSSNPCTQYGPQQWTLTISNGNYTSQATTVIYDPHLPTSASTVGAASQLVWLQSPTSGIVGSQVSPQPEIAVEDSNNNIVSSDFSSVTLSISSGPPGGILSNTCSGVESYGVIPFGDCSLSVAGTYVLKASDSNSGVTSATSSSFVVSPAPAAKLVFTTSAQTGVASANANLGVITVQEQDPFGNPVNGAATVNLASTSSGSIFASISGGTTPITSVSIPAGSSTASFYYGDTVAGDPMITASSNGLAPATQVETVNPAPASKLVFTSNPFTAAQSANATNPFTVSLEDPFGNLTTSGTNTTVNLSSSSGTGRFAKTSGGTESATLPVTISAGSSGVTAYYGDTTVGTPVLTAASSPLTSATQTENIVLTPTKLVFTSSALTGTASSSANLGPITVQEESATGIPTVVPETVNLSSTSGSGLFSLTSGGTTPITSITIPAGSSAATFYYGDTTAGTPTLTGAATGLTPATQKETVNPGPLSSFTLSTPSPTAGSAFTETITATDAFGNTVTTYAGLQPFTFTGPGMSPLGNTPQYPASVNFTGGVGTATITLFDAQNTSITAASALVTGTSANFTVSPNVTSVFSLSTPTAPITAGSQFTESITATDAYGNSAATYSGRECLTFSGPASSPNGTAPAYPGPRNPCATSSVRFTNGAATAAITLYDAQTTTLTATQSPITGSTPAFTVNPAAASTTAVSSGSGQSATISTAFTNPLVALVTDSYGNPVSGTTVTFAPPGSGASATISGGNTAVTNASGLATSGTLTANGTTGAYSVSASAPGTNTATFSETNNPGPAAKLTFTTQPAAGANVKATGTGTFNVSVAVQDASGNTETGDNATTVTLAINNNPSAGVLTCANTGGLTVTVASGVANFTGCAITKAGTGYTLTASSVPAQAAPANANAFNITAGTASTTAVSSGSGQSATIGGSFINPLVALVTDANGNPISGATVTFTPPGSGASATISGGNAAVTNASGLATSGTLTANGTSGNYNVSASAPGTNTATFSETNNPGAATKLTFTTQPTTGANIQATGTGTFNVSVAVQDAGGNTETGDNATTVTLAINHNAGPGGVFTCANTGGLTVTVTAGVANFTGCAITKTGAGYTLTASSTPAHTAPGNANAFNITAGTATNLTFTTQPAAGSSIQAKGTGSFSASAAVQDTNGNTVLTDTRNVTLAIGSNPSFGLLSCTNTGGLTVAANAGVANFTGCAITKVGTGYLLTATSTPALTVPLNANAFNITAGAASTTAVSSGSGQSATISTAFSNPLVALVTDANGNPISGATVTFTPPGSGASATISGGNTAVTNAGGLATSGTLTANVTAGGYSVTAAATGTTTATFSETNNPGPATKLTFTTQPTAGSNVQATGTGTFNVSVAEQDANSNTETGDNATTVTLAINNNPSAGVLSCTNTGGLTVTVASGVANFTGCAITKAGTGYTLTATSTPAHTAPANANAFNITAGAATNLTFTNQPTAGSNVQATGTGTFNVSVAEQDANSNTETGDNATTVTLAINNNPSAGVLSCTNTGGLTVTVASGVANFTGCAITKAGTGYTLKASSAPAHAAPANANAFNITAGAASTTAVSSGSGQSATISTAFSNPLVALVTDANGNPISGATVTFTPPGSGASATISGGNTAVTNAGGLATSGTLTANVTAGGYSVTAAATGTTTATFSETNNPGPATKLTFTTQPTAGSNVQATGTGTFNVSVAEQDANSNTETGDNATTVTLAINNNPSAGVLSCTSGLGPRTVTAGVANFTGCAITKAGTGYTLKASSAPAHAAPANANAFNITAGAASTTTVSSGSGQSATVGAAFTSPLVALVTDANGNTVPLATVTFTPPGSGASASINGGNTAVTNAGGLATSGALTANTTAGAYGVTAAATGTTTATFSETNNPGPATKLTFTTQPAAGANIQTTGTGTFNVSVAEQDANSNTETGDNATTVTLVINNNPSAGVLTCTNTSGLTVTVAAGLANFTGCAITKAGTGYTLTATSTPAHTAPANANAFNMTAGTATNLTFTTQPGGTVGEGMAFTQPTVTAKDTNSNTVSGVAITLNIASYTAGGGGSTEGAITGCTNPVTTSATGVATFSGCEITGSAAAGTYTFGASANAGALTATATGSVSITAGSATSLTFTTPPAGSVHEGVAFTQPVLIVEDANGNAASGIAVTLNIASYTAGGGGSTRGVITGCTNPVTTSATGVATFSGCEITGSAAAGTYTFGASANAGALTATATGSISITAGSASTISTTSGSGQSRVIGGAFANPLVATVTDTNGNEVSGVTVTFAGPTTGASGTFAATGCTGQPPTSACAVTTNASGQATSTTFTANGTAGSYTISGSVTGLTAVTFSETNVARPVVTSVVSDANWTGNAATSATFGTTAGDTYIVTGFDNSTSGTIAAPTVTIGGSAMTLISGSTNTFGTAGTSQNCPTANVYCYEWAWSYKATTTGTPSVTMSGLGGGTNAGASFDVLQVTNVNATTPIVQVNVASGCGVAGNGCTTTSTTATANLTNTPSAGSVSLEVIGSDSTIGALTWSAGSTTLFSTSNTNDSLAVYDTSPAAQTDTASVAGWPNTRKQAWGTIALEIGGM